MMTIPSPNHGAIGQPPPPGRRDREVSSVITQPDPQPNRDGHTPLAKCRIGLAHCEKQLGYAYQDLFKLRDLQRAATPPPGCGIRAGESQEAETMDQAIAKQQGCIAVLRTRLEELQKQFGQLYKKDLNL